MSAARTFFGAVAIPGGKGSAPLIVTLGNWEELLSRKRPVLAPLRRAAFSDEPRASRHIVGRLDMTIARVIAIVLLLVAIGWVFYTMIYPNLRRR